MAQYDKTIPCNHSMRIFGRYITGQKMLFDSSTLEKILSLAAKFLVLTRSHGELFMELDNVNASQ